MTIPIQDQQPLFLLSNEVLNALIQLAADYDLIDKPALIVIATVTEGGFLCVSSKSQMTGKYQYKHSKVSRAIREAIVKTLQMNTVDLGSVD